MYIKSVMRDYLGDLGMDGKIILNWNLKEHVVD